MSSATNTWSSIASKLGHLNLNAKQNTHNSRNANDDDPTTIPPINDYGDAHPATSSTQQSHHTSHPTSNMNNNTTNIKNKNKKSNNKPLPIHHIILDSGAFIMGSSSKDRLLQYTQSPHNAQLYTIPEIRANELHDANSKYMYDTFPYPINTLHDINDTSMNAVVSFSKLSGDYYTLSAVDLKIAALTYQLHRENHGVENVFTKPKGRENQYQRIFANNKQKNVNTPDTPSRHSSVQSTTLNDTLDYKNDKQEDDDNTLNHAPEMNMKEKKSIDEEKEKSQDDDLVNNSGHHRDASNEVDAELQSIDGDGDVMRAPDDEENDSLRSDVKGEDDDNHDDDDGEGEWITEDNIHRLQQTTLPATEQNKRTNAHNNMNHKQITHPSTNNKKKKKNAVDYSASRSSVVCVTTDFTLQNLLLQMGLRLLSVNGMSIRNTRKYVKRCYTCYEITHDMSPQFCAVCGNNTLIRVSSFIDGNGVSHFNTFTRPISHRGARYSIPKPVGGRQSADLILCEDMMPEFKRSHHKNQKKSQQKGQEDLYHTVPEYGTLQSNKVSLQHNTSHAEVGYGNRNWNVNYGSHRRIPRNT